MADFYEALDSETSVRKHIVRFVGGTTAVTKELGRGMTITYVSTGLVDLTWTDNPGRYLGPEGAPGFSATTLSTVAGFTAAVGAYNSTTKTVRVAIWNGSNSLVDLSSTQHLNVTLLFSADAAN